jgi:Clostridial hydrophobic W
VNTRPNIKTARRVSDDRGVSLTAVKASLRQELAHADQLLAAEDTSKIKLGAKILKLDGGLYAVSVGETSGVSGPRSGIMLPGVNISIPPSDRLGAAEIVASTGASAYWLGSAGGTVVIKAPSNGGQVLITTYECADQPSTHFGVAVRRIDLPVPEPVPTRVGEEAAFVPLTRKIRTEILLHIERAGDRQMSAEGWVGNRGKKLRIEAFSIRPLETLAPSDIEYKAYGPNARETPWISDGNLCGTRGRSLPLTGFAVRVAAHLKDHFDIEYQGAFFESGATDATRNGEPCMARIADDPLEAINLRLFERVGR